MKFLFRLILASLTVASLAKADYLGRFDMTYDSYKRINLSECHGYATVRAYSDSLLLKVYGNDNCSRVKVNEKTFVSDQDYYGNRSIEINISLDYGRNSAQVVVTSKTGHTRDSFTLVKNNDSYSHQPPTLHDEDWVYLSYCRGYAKFDVENGQANLKLKNIDLNRCSKVSLYSNGDYRSYRLDSESSSFTVPKSMIDYGSNKVRVSFTTRYGETVDKVNLKFRAH